MNESDEVLEKKENELEIHSPFNNSRYKIQAAEFEFQFSAPANNIQDIIKGLREFANLLEHSEDPKNQRTLQEAVDQMKQKSNEQVDNLSAKIKEIFNPCTYS